MKQNPLLIAVLALVVLGGLVYYTRQNPPTPDSDAVPLVRVEETAVRKVTVIKPGSEPIVVQRDAGQSWTFGNGVTVPADDSAINLMVTNLASLDASRVVQEQTSDWSPYGLEGDGLLRVTMETAGAAPKSIIFGEDTPTGSAVFARLDGDSRLFTAFSYARDNFDKTIFDWRDKRFLRANPDSIKTITLDIGTRRFKFAKDVRNWQITEPTNLRADRLAVADLERELTSVQMSSVLAEGNDAVNEYSVASPYAVAEVVDAAGSHVLTIAEGGPSGYFAKSSDLPGGVYEVPESFVASLDRQLDDYRNPNLFDFGFDDLSRINIRDGSKRATIEKQEQDWKLTTDGNRVVSAEQVQTLIDALRNLSAVAYPSIDAAAQARYGLDAPEIELETTLAGAAAGPERVVISDPSQPAVYAARVGEPSTYEVETEAAQKIRQALDAVLTPAAAE